MTKRLLIAMIWSYKYISSLLLLGQIHPSCSEYAVDAIRMVLQKGAGFHSGEYEVSSLHPGGYDPVK
jgi:putative component of membrane protein insertase Oxa1/YidC/SpoIIIJ protein YidD